eukprot:CAMPEP_0175295692 /NCGR_PEP_ID=MMETSP0093-20121207/58643_1 /TAXON_ID=311494 /ORGANISM="Alexandrium monilatum, Strain CCMP3105" /LENGTH=49 /DNA_ID=CAMNT_0016591663 /DNA_START=1 /DNA_END=153 /DNA_ORIENTATION=+
MLRSGSVLWVRATSLGIVAAALGGFQLARGAREQLPALVPPIPHVPLTA